MYPILGRYGPFIFYSYTAALGLGILVSLGLTIRLERHAPTPGWKDALLTGALLALVGGRAGYVYANWHYFQQQPAEIWQVWQGGLSYHGALLAGVAGLWLWSLRRGSSFTRLAGLLAPALALASSFGWLACWLEGCAYGRETTHALWSADLPDSYGVFGVRYQTQAAGFLLTLLIFGTALLWRRKMRTGKLFLLVLACLSAGRLIVGLMRGDPVPTVDQVRLDTVIDGAMTAISLILLQYTGFKRSSPIETDAAVNQKKPEHK